MLQLGGGEGRGGGSESEWFIEKRHVFVSFEVVNTKSNFRLT